jgi:hypothetical protein
VPCRSNNYENLFSGKKSSASCPAISLGLALAAGGAALMAF